MFTIGGGDAGHAEQAPAPSVRRQIQGVRYVQEVECGSLHSTIILGGEHGNAPS